MALSSTVRRSTPQRTVIRPTRPDSPVTSAALPSESNTDAFSPATGRTTVWARAPGPGAGAVAPSRLSRWPACLRLSPSPALAQAVDLAVRKTSFWPNVSRAPAPCGAASCRLG